MNERKDTEQGFGQGFETKSFEIKQGVDESGTFGGYAAVFGNVDHDGDIILPGAFRKALGERIASGDDVGPDMQVLWMHDPRKPIGRVTQASEDEKGLRFSAFIVNTRDGEDAMKLLRTKTVRRMSFGYRVTKALWANNITELTAALVALGVDTPTSARIQAEAVKGFERFGHGIRLLAELDAWEVSPVSRPANDKSAIDSVKRRKDACEPLTPGGGAVDDAPVEDPSGAEVAQNEESKAGRTFSAKDIARLKAAADALETAAGEIFAVVDAAAPPKGVTEPEGEGEQEEVTPAEPEVVVSSAEAITSLKTAAADLVSVFTPNGGS